MSKIADLVNRTKLGSAVDNDLALKIKELSKETRIPVSKLLDEAITLLLQNYEKK